MEQNQSEPREISWEELQDIMNPPGKKLGSGGFGEVFEGNLDGKPVAIKKTSVYRKKSHVDQYEAEKRFLNPNVSKLRHRNIIQLKGYGEHKEIKNNKLTDHFVWLVYELMPASLEDKIGMLNWEQILDILQQTADMLAYIHRENIVHNDIKPANILITEDFVVKVADFGAADKVGQHVRSGSAAYTLLPAASGASTSKKFDLDKSNTRNDMHAFGVTMLQIIMKRKDPGHHKDGSHILLDAREKTEKKQRVFAESIGIEKNKAELLYNLALQCCSDNPPEMRNVLRKLQGL